MRKDNRGVTMIELIVMVAIGMIFSGVVLTFVGSTAKTYRYTSGGVKSQMESQDILDQLKNMTMNADSYLYYAKGAGSLGNTGDRIQGDGDLSDPLQENKTFYIGNSNGGEAITWQMITWDSQKKYLYSEIGGKKEVLGKNVSVFAVDISKAKKTRLVEFYLTVENSKRKVEKKESITLRNEVSIKAPNE